jgi:hypothetical protein
MTQKQQLLILAHGIFGWGMALTDGADPTPDYFYGVQPFLAEHYGNELMIEAPTVQPAESVEQRGQELRAAIQRALRRMTSGTWAHIIAHSMGGLDARWVIAMGGVADQIASLTTIATPHGGTTLGTLTYHLRHIIRRVGRALDTLGRLSEDLQGAVRQAVASMTGKSATLPSDALSFYHRLLQNVIEHSTPAQLERGLEALTLDGAAAFNARLAHAEHAVRARTTNRVQYFAYGGHVAEDHVPLLKPSFDILRHWGTEEERTSGNDGAVSVWSAHFPWDSTGDHYIATLPYDHFRQIN